MFAIALGMSPIEKITVAISAYQKTSLDSELEVFKNSQSQEIIEEKPLIEDLPE